MASLQGHRFSINVHYPEDTTRSLVCGDIPPA
jgi:hypothetical protein